MRVAGYGLFRYALPLTEPLTSGGATLDEREGLLLRLSGEDGSQAWGEAAPLPGFSRESLQEAASQLRDLASSMVGRDAAELWDRPTLGESGPPAPSVGFGLDLALWNLRAAASGKALPELVSPSPRVTVPVNALIPGGDPDRALEEARRARREGYLTVKLKVGVLGVGEEAALVMALREELGDDVSLRLDANRAWGFDDARRFLCAVEDAGIAYVEEPISDPRRLADLADETGAPVALDESLATLQPQALDRHRYARAVILKPTLLGGLHRTLRFAREAARLGIGQVVSSAYESGVGTASLVALAAGVGDGPVPAGLDTYRRLAGDVLLSRLGLPAPEVDVRGVIRAARDVDVRRLELLHGS